MSDFYQNGVVTVLHRLGQRNVDQLERELTRYGRVNPIALVLPSLYAELGRPALKAIVETLKTVSYLNEIVISLDRASALEFRLAKQFFSADMSLTLMPLAADAEAQAGAVAPSGQGEERSPMVNEALRIFGGSVRSVRKQTV